MSRDTESEVVYYVLADYFGKSSGMVGRLLTNSGPMPMQLISQQLNLKRAKIKQILTSLYYHNLLTISHGSRDLMVYAINVENLFHFRRIPKYIWMANQLYGVMGKRVIRAMAELGLCKLSEIIVHVMLNLSDEERKSDKVEVLPVKVYETFRRLLNDQFVYCEIDTGKLDFDEQLLIRANDRDNEDLTTNNLPSLDFSKFSTSLSTHIIATIKSEPGSQEPLAKKRRLDGGDSGVAPYQAHQDTQYWRIKYDSFEVEQRAEFITDAVKTYYRDSKLGQVMLAMLKLGAQRTHHLDEVSAHISRQEIIKQLIEDRTLSSERICGKYLSVFENDKQADFVNVAERTVNGEKYVIRTMHILTQLVQEAITSIVQHNHGQNCARIFRMMVKHRFLQQKQVDEIAMLPQKHSRELLFTLVAKGYLEHLAVPRMPNEYVPSRIVYEFNADLEKLAMNTVNHCKQAAFNMYARREGEFCKRQILIDTKKSLDKIAATIQADPDTPEQEKSIQIKEVYSRLSNYEFSVLDKLKQSCKKLAIAQFQLDETQFLMEHWLKLRQANSRLPL